MKLKVPVAVVQKNIDRSKLPEIIINKKYEYHTDIRGLRLALFKEQDDLGEETIRMNFKKQNMYNGSYNDQCATFHLRTTLREVFESDDY